MSEDEVLRTVEALVDKKLQASRPPERNAG
jgi:hypothetical protein